MEDSRVILSGPPVHPVPTSSATRVLFVTRYLACGGVERTVLNLVEHLGDGVSLAALDPRDDLSTSVRRQERVRRPHDGPAWRWLRGPGPLRKLLLDVVYGVRLQLLLWRHRPRVLVTTCLDSTIVAAFTLRNGARWIGMVGSDLHEHLERVLPRWSRPLHRLLGLVYTRPQVVVAPTRGLRDVLVRSFGVPPSRAVAVANMVDTERVRALAAAPLDDAAPPPRFVLGVGRLVAAKGFDLLLHALAPLTDIPLVLLGEGPERGPLAALADRLAMRARVTFVPFDPNPWRWMANADLVVAPSRAEGFGNVVAEAQACGAALLVSDCAHGPREIVRPEVSAATFPAGDVDALREAIGRLWADPARRARLRAGGPSQDDVYGVATVRAAWERLLA